MDGILQLLFPIIFLGIIIITIIAMWKVYTKAGEPGWAILVPIYNLIVLLRICGKPAWWVILAFIPIVSLIMLVIPFRLAERFGKGAGFGLGLLLFGFIFYPLLAFSDAEYIPIDEA